MIDYGYGVSLRAIYSDDKIIRQWRNDYGVWRWSRQFDLISDMAQDRWIEAQDKDPTSHMYVIRDAYGCAAGVGGLSGHDFINRKAEISLYINKDSRGKGYSRSAFKTIMRYGFENLNLHSIWCDCLENNPVIKIVESIGFKNDGVKRDAYFKEGKYVNAIMFSILEGEWTP